MKLKEYLLGYEIEEGKPVCNIFDYYRQFIKPLDDRFKYGDLQPDKKVICFFKDHEDVNPSLGVIKDTKHVYKHQYLYHCFGCGKTGDVVRLHQIIEEQYHNRKLNQDDACKELARLFNIPLGDFEELDDEDYEGMLRLKIKRANEVSTHYNMTDFSKGLLNIRKKAQGRKLTPQELGRVNSECVKIIASNKFLY